ncbi:hypothetical protein RJ641_026254 [Dillenia turbinata]|uniref:Uncharacterized protein n=1 Tax=Dillenia turbinata TaxID=194707 RepID=A0AAN8ZPR5_9MAGN
MPGVYRVDLLTRQVSSPEVDWSYGEPTEMLTLRSSEGFLSEIGESSGWTNSGLWAFNSLELLALQLDRVTGEIITTPEPIKAVFT